MLSTNERADAATEGAVVATLKSIDTLTRRLTSELRSHPEIQARLSGAIWALVGGSNNSAAREILKRHVTGVGQLGVLARNCLFLGVGDKEAQSLGPNADVPAMIFISALLNFWRFDLNLPITNWIGAHSQRDSASPFTSFAKACFDVAGFPLTFEAVRLRVKRALRLMDRNEAAGLDWNVLKVGSPALICKRS